MKANNFTKHIAMDAAAAICVGAATMGAHAEEAPTRVVRYSVHDLHTPAGIAVLYRRIHNAAEEFCGDGNSRPPSKAVIARACVREAVDASIRSMGNVKLAQEYAARRLPALRGRGG
jgi:UrcA family protein